MKSRLRQQRERQKRNLFYDCTRIFVHSIAVTARLQREISSSHVLGEDVNTKGRLSFSFFEQRCGP